MILALYVCYVVLFDLDLIKEAFRNPAKRESRRGELIAGKIIMRKIFVVLIGLLVWENQVSAIVYVDADRAGGNGTSWVQAYKTIEAAISGEGENEEFWIAEGTYLPAYTLDPRTGSEFYGGFSGSETTRSQRNIGLYPTVINGSAASARILYVSSLVTGVRLDGLTFTKGTGVDSVLDGHGGAVCVDRTYATIADCVFDDNSASVYGGGLFLYRNPSSVTGCRFVDNSSGGGGGLAANRSGMTISYCDFVNNSALSGVQEGGGMRLYMDLYTVEDCNFIDNNSRDGGGLQLTETTTTVSRCTFTNNSVTSGGGGAHMNKGKASYLECSFTQNSCDIQGGGIYTFYGPVTVEDSTFYMNTAPDGAGISIDYDNGQTDYIRRCRFVSNTASSEGGGFHSYARDCVFESCSFEYNSAPNGGGVRLHAGSGATANPDYQTALNNCTFYKNDATTGFGGGMVNTLCPMVYLNNCIFWTNTAGNAGGDIHNTGSSSMTTRYCDIPTNAGDHGSVTEINIARITEDPEFSDADGADNVEGNLDDDLSLKESSPCVDAAHGDYAPDTDILGYARSDIEGVANTGVGTPDYADIGAYELPVIVADPVFTPGPDVFSNAVSVEISCATTGAVIRYTTNGTTPTESSVSGTNVYLLVTTTLRARAYKDGAIPSAITTAVYTVTDTDDDGLPDWMETDTGVYVSTTNTGTDPNLPDTDGDGFNDWIEVQQGYDPNDSTDFPKVKADFDGDGKSDYGCYDAYGIPGIVTPGQWYFMKTTDGFDASVSFGYGGTVPVVGDFDNDGTSDYGCYDAAGIPGIVTPGQWYFMMSSNGFDASVSFGYPGTVPVVGDFDGDGTDDYGCYDAYGIPGAADPGSWYFMTSSNGFLVSVFGYGGTVPVVGDFDGDGIDDFGCYDAAGIPGIVTPGQWYFMMSSNGFDASVSFGYAGTVPVVGDFDGDDIDDYGCYDDAGIPGVVDAGQWYFMKSTERFDASISFGYAGTVPVVGDYDGDGTDDVGCYDAVGKYGQSPGSWYFMKSTDGFSTTAFGYDGTVPLGGILTE